MTIESVLLDLLYDMYMDQSSILLPLYISQIVSHPGTFRSYQIKHVSSREKEDLNFQVRYF